MKNLLLIILLLSFSVIGRSQNNTLVSQKSNAEKFSETSGTLIQREIIDLGSVGKTKIQVAIFTDLMIGKKSTAVRFEKVVMSSIGSDTKIGTIDADELDGLIKSLKIISNTIFPTTVINYTEVNYISRGGFTAGCFWDKKGWSSFMKIEKYDSDSYEFLSKREDFDSLLSLLEQAKSKLL